MKREQGRRPGGERNPPAAPLSCRAFKGGMVDGRTAGPRLASAAIANHEGLRGTATEPRLRRINAVAAMMIVKGTESSAYVPFILSLYGWVCSPLVLGRARFGNPESMAPGANCYPCWSRWDRTT